MSVIVRRVLPHEYPKYLTHLKTLDQNSRTLRFAHPVGEYAIEEWYKSVEENKEKHVLFCVENRKLEFVGIGHIALDKNPELAFSVLKKYQGRGIGSALMDRCIQWCRINGILKGYMLCLSHNTTIKHLCKKQGLVMHSEYGETTAEVDLREASLATYVKEGFDQNLGMIDYMSKRAKFLSPFALI